MSQAAIMPEWMQQRLAGTAAQPGEVELAPDEVPAVALFLALGTQWRRHPMTGMLLGLDYAAVPPTAAMTGTEMTPALFADLRLMEDAAIGALAEGAAR